jgi:acyl-CoA thioesterase-1
MSDPMLEKLIRFQHPDRVLGFARPLTDQTLASIFGTDEETYRATLSDIEVQRANAVNALAADPAVHADLLSVPFVRGAHIVAVGESTTADRLSWFEILRTLLDAERPDLELRFDNLAITGATTTQVLAGLPAIRRQSADWVFCMLGSNDSQRFDSADGPQLVTRAETLRNLRELRARSLPDETSRWVWVTPTPVDESLVADFTFFRIAGITWTNADLSDLSKAFSELTDDLVIDSAPAVAATGGDPAFIEDGVHPSIATQAALASRVLAALGERALR